MAEATQANKVSLREALRLNGVRWACCGKNAHN